MVYDRAFAARPGRRPVTPAGIRTGWRQGGAGGARGGIASVDPLVAPAERGVRLTRSWSAHVVVAGDWVITGMTGDVRDWFADGGCRPAVSSPTRS